MSHRVQQVAAVSLLLAVCAGCALVDSAQETEPPADSHVQIAGLFGDPLLPLNASDVRDAARYSRIFTYAASVRSPVKVGEPVELTVWLTNTSGREYMIDKRNFDRAQTAFAYWVARDGRQIPLSTDLQQQVRRYSFGSVGNNVVPAADRIKPGDVVAARVDLRSMFRIRLPGHYTVVVEPGAVEAGTSYGDRAAAAVKASFDVAG